jgi:hypothetical protein
MKEGSAWFERTGFNLAQILKSLAMRHCQQLGFGKQFLGQRVPAHLAFFHQERGRAFDDLIQAPVLEKETHHQVVHRQQGECADQSAQQRIIVADDGVLNGVGERKKDHQVEGVQLRQFPFAEHAQHDDEENVDQDGPQNLFKDRELDREHVGDNR